MKFRVVGSFGAIGTISRCQECSWFEEDYLKGTTPARKHVVDTGHTVSVEKTLAAILERKP